MGLTARGARDDASGTLRSMDNSLMVTVRAMALYDKRQFRAYKEFTGNLSLRLTVPKPFLLTSLRLWSASGAVRCVVSTGGSSSGTFTKVQTTFCLNTVDGDVAAKGTLSSGGTHTGGAEREVLLSNSGLLPVGNGDAVVSPRYMAAGTYYFDITSALSTGSGILTMEWEEDV